MFNPRSWHFCTSRMPFIMECRKNMFVRCLYLIPPLFFVNMTFQCTDRNGNECSSHTGTLIVNCEYGCSRTRLQSFILST